MKRIILLILCVSLLSSINAQETKFKELSYAEFFKMIDETEDSIFRFQDAIIRFNLNTDSLFVQKVAEDTTIQKRVIDKKIVLNNVHFTSVISLKGTEGIITNIDFKRDVIINQVRSLHIRNCTFTGDFNAITNQSETNDLIPKLNNDFYIGHSRFLKGGNISYFLPESAQEITVTFHENEVWTNEKSRFTNGFGISAQNIGAFNIVGNKVFNSAFFNIYARNNWANNFVGNEFHNLATNITISDNQNLFMNSIEQNTFDNYVFVNFSELTSKSEVSWNQFKSRINNWMSFNSFMNIKSEDADSVLYMGINYHSIKAFDLYTQYKIEDEKTFNTEMGLLGQFYAFYKSKFNNHDANAVYVEMKDLETARLKFLFQQNPDFDTFFTLKINQFLKTFSAYGTKPSRAIIFSLYVILIFALIYLFFPNSWDSHGKHRIIHRYTFFMKYLNRNQGIHEVYLEEKQRDLLAYEEFRQYIEMHSKTVPRFFVATALPLYKWALSGTKLTASLLSRFDVLKGTWQEVPPAHRWWKVLLLIGAFLIAIAYDILIKILNALMLSINTFTTLGFGEIPIKGLPRYLAIIQGFIGWFMLTIFSVSLISQLLN